MKSTSVNSSSHDAVQPILNEVLSFNSIPTLFIQRYGPIPRICVRQCYRELYDLASQNMIDLHDKFPVTLFTGVPGIGKSLFLLYFIVRFLNDERFVDKRFLLEFQSGEY